jgi:hypothetical protein
MLLLTKKFMGISGIPITTNGDTMGIQWGYSDHSPAAVLHPASDVLLVMGWF